jgi:hypothetical protein
MTVFWAMLVRIILFFDNTKEPAEAGRNELQPWSDGAKERLQAKLKEIMPSAGTESESILQAGCNGIIFI